MSLKIHKHFDYQTPFSEATNADELEHIMRLKYPKACSSLEVGAGFFACMVADVKKYEAWKVIGFSSFEAFCKEELNKTISEVEEIVEGVKLLGGNPTESEAKKASKAERAREMKAEHPEMSQSEIAREVGVTRQAAHKACQPRKCNTEKVDKVKTPTIRLAKDPSLTARNIIQKMGEEYAGKLADELRMAAS